MSINNPVMHEGYVPAYQASAVPFVTCSVLAAEEVHEINFPQVTRFFNVQNLASSGAVISIAFTQNGLKPINANFFKIGPGDSFRDELRVTKLFVSCSEGSNVNYQVMAGLTGIPASQFLTVTGSNGYASVG